MKKKWILVALLILVGCGFYGFRHLQNFDVRGVSLTEREQILSSSGKDKSFLFEFNEGAFEFILHRFQHGERINQQTIPTPLLVGDDGEVSEGFKVQNRSWGSISVSNVQNDIITVSHHGGVASVVGIEETNIKPWTSMAFESIDRRLSLGAAEVPLLYVVMTNGGIPSALTEILSPSFQLDDQLPQFQDIQELFIVTVQKK